MVPTVRGSQGKLRNFKESGKSWKVRENREGQGKSGNFKSSGVPKQKADEKSVESDRHTVL